MLMTALITLYQDSVSRKKRKAFTMELWYLLPLWLILMPTLRGQEAPLDSVLYSCNDTFVSVTVKVNAFGMNKRLDPAGLTLGKCPVSSTTALFGYLVFEYRFSTCGFNRMDIGEGRTYFANLVYKPPQTSENTPFTKEIICIVTRPQTPVPVRTTVMESVSGLGNLTFSYRFMNGDFSDSSDSKDFTLGSPINLELSVDLGNHMPMRLFVDEGIATSTEDITILPKYDLITNYGCFIDGKVADSQFIAQTQSNRIWLTFPAMSFVVPSGQIYLTFKLAVWDPKSATELKKACSYFRDTKRWELLGSTDNTICLCCEYGCKKSSRRKRSVGGNEDCGLVHTMVLGPFKVHGTFNNGRHGAAGNKSEVAQTGFLLSPAVGALILELTLLFLLCIGVILNDRLKTNEKDAEER